MPTTRRELAALLAASAAAAAQQPAPPAPAQQDENALAKQRYQRTGEALDKLELPITLEPAFRFEIL